MIGSRTFEDEFAYGFDDPIDTVSYSRAVRISGWLVNVKAQPIHGIRLIARNGLWPCRVTRARRKRSRPDVALEFPDVPDARASGFLIETQLRSGRNQISIQVQDEQKRWRTFFSTAIKVFPLDLLEKLDSQTSATILPTNCNSAIPRRRPIFQCLNPSVAGPNAHSFNPGAS